MKRGGPLRRRTGLRRNPPKGEARQRRDARLREDAAWRAECFRIRGSVCRGCGSTRDVQMDHIVGRVGSDRLALGNGLPLCGDFGDGRCHPRKTARQLLIQRDWLDQDMIDWLACEGYAVWETDGTVSGRHCVRFARILPVGTTQWEE